MNLFRKSLVEFKVFTEFQEKISTKFKSTDRIMPFIKITPDKIENIDQTTITLNNNFIIALVKTK